MFWDDEKEEENGRQQGLSGNQQDGGDGIREAARYLALMAEKLIKSKAEA